MVRVLEGRSGGSLVKTTYIATPSPGTSSSPTMASSGAGDYEEIMNKVSVLSLLSIRARLEHGRGSAR